MWDIGWEKASGPVGIMRYVGFVSIEILLLLLIGRFLKTPVQVDFTFTKEGTCIMLGHHIFD